MKRILIIVGIALIPIIPVVLVVSGVLKRNPTTVNAVTLTVWGTEDTNNVMKKLSAVYAVTHPYVTIKYQKVRSEDYFQQLVSAWAQGKGPDVYFVPSMWIGQMTQYAVPIPADITVPQVVTHKGIFGASRQVVSPKDPAPTTAALRDGFVDAVTSDIIRKDTKGKEQVWGLPLSMDTVVTYYNKDLLNQAKIFEPAKTWPDLKSQVEQNHLTIVDNANQLVQSGVALGTANNVSYASDILALLMMQNGATMTTNNGKARFQEKNGLAALSFYTSFALPSKTTYSWSADRPNARDAFLQGKVAYYFGSLADYATIKAGSVNFDVAPMLHLDTNGDKDAVTGGQRFIDVARYQVGMVSKAADIGHRSLQAWNYLRFIARTDNVNSYLKSTGRLSALRKILSTQKNDPALSTFANQLLTARGWYRGNAGPLVDGYFSALITSVVDGKTDPQQALNLAAKQIESTL